MSSPIHILDRRKLYMDASDLMGKKGYVFMCNVLAELLMETPYSNISRLEVSSNIYKYFPELWTHAPKHALPGVLCVWFPSSDYITRRMILRQCAIGIDLQLNLHFPDYFEITREMIDKSNLT